ncbi:hypothetical protein D3C87_377760 [compost metagenome]
MKAMSWLILSLALHGVLVGTLMSLRVVPEPEVAEEIVDLQIVMETRSVGGPFRGQGTSRTGSASSANKALVQNLFQRYDLKQESHEVAAVSESDAADFQVGPANMLGDSDNWDFHRQVFTKIDENLMFDSLLAQYNHFGSVHLRFAVDPHGYLIEKSLRARAEDPILKVHVVRALRLALNEEFPSSKWAVAGKNITFEAKFDFLQMSSFINHEKQKGFVKPQLQFQRATTEKPIPNTLSEQLTSGGIDYDLFAAAERWQKYNKKKKLANYQFDPFAHYKKDPAYNL